MFADSVRTVRLATQKSVLKLDGNNIQYTDMLANVYQEWHIVKKNKYGRRQERIIGIDGKKVYNSKRGERRGVGGIVTHAEREIKTIRNLEILQDNEKRTLRITWEEDNRTDLREIEYICETSKDCSDIYAKLTFLMKNLKK